MADDDMTLLTKCLDFCQLLGNRGSTFQLSVTISDFTFTMNHGRVNASGEIGTKFI